MKILLVVHQFFPEYRAGTEVLTLETARGLLRKGHRVEILTGAPRLSEPSTTPPSLIRDVYDGITVHRVQYGSARARDPFALHTSAPDRVALVERVVLQSTPDLVHVTHFQGLSSAIIPAIRSLRAPVVYAATDYWAICPQCTLLHAFDDAVCEGPGDGTDCVRCCVERFSRSPQRAATVATRLVGTWPLRSSRTLRQVESLTKRPARLAEHVNRSSMIVSATRFLADMLVRNGIDAGLMRVIPYGIDIGDVRLQPDIPSRFTPSEPLRLAFIGTMAAIKGPHVVLDALVRLGEAARAIAFTLYGAVEPHTRYARELGAMIDRAGGVATLAGTFPHDRIGEVVSGSHLLVLPSLWYESTPLVLCAALAAGTPALVSRLGGMTELVEDGVNGMSFPAGDAQALSMLLRRLLENPGLVAGLRRTTVARRRFTAAYVDDLEAAFLEVRQEASRAR